MIFVVNRSTISNIPFFATTLQLWAGSLETAPLAFLRKYMTENAQSIWDACTDERAKLFTLS